MARFGLLRVSAPLVLALAACAAPAPLPEDAAARAPVPAVAARPPPPEPVAAPAESVAESIAAPSTPPYDLAADIAARRDALLAQHGNRTAIELVEGVFVVAAPQGAGALALPVRVTKLALAAYFNGRFDRRPDRAITVLLFPDERPYNAWCKKRWKEDCDSRYGFYLREDRLIVMNVGPGIGTLTHELVHPLMAADFPNAPDWIDEGIASLFEQPVFSIEGEIHGGKNWRHPRLLSALASREERRYASLPALFTMSDRVFRGEREDLHYAAARYFCQWMDQKKLLWPFYHRWRDTYATDPTGERAFREVTGKTPTEMHDAWTKWVQRL